MSASEDRTIRSAATGEAVSAKATHEQGRELRAREVRSFEALAARIGSLRLAVVAVALCLVGGIVWMKVGFWAWAALGAMAAVFAVLIVLHARAIEAGERSAAALRFHERALARLAHEWDSLPLSSARFRSSDHPFTGDLDVFGRASLMQLVDSTETRFGEEALARLLSLEGRSTWPDDLVARQEAVRDLASRSAFREQLSMAGGVLGGERPDPTPILAWAQAEDAPPSLVAWALFQIPIALLALPLLLASPKVGSGMIFVVFVVDLAIGMATSARFSRMIAAVSSRESAVTRWRSMIAMVELEAFTAPLLVRMRERLTRGGRSASVELARFERIVGFADARHNEAFRFLIGPLLRWDAYCARALLGWRARAGAEVRGWLDTLGEIEALCGLAAFAFEHPDFRWPEPSAQPLFVASALGHPLIAEGRRVDNDVKLPAGGRALVVTGSNMSGKSTLLRAIGANAVLAFAGAPVCARSLAIGPARIATSMRIEDSLEQGVSQFYAELRRLKRVLDLASEDDAAPVLFLLDEILHGTNSRERIIGASAVVRALLARRALGAVSTHDLGITELERALSGSVENVHFEEQVERDMMTFDYRLRRGVVQSSNALRLMSAMGFAIPDG